MYGHSFPNLKFPKKGSSILDKVNAKREAMVAKINERETRIEATVKEKGLTAADLFQNIDQFTGRTSGGVENSVQFTAAEKSGLITEANKLKEEREELKELVLIAHNLPPDDTFELSFEELSLFGF